MSFRLVGYPTGKPEACLTTKNNFRQSEKGGCPVPLKWQPGTRVS
jgi:hypothetical protein